MAVTLPPHYVDELDSVFSKASKAMKTGIDSGSFEPRDLLRELTFASESFSVWLGCHATDSIRIEFDQKAKRVRRSCLMLVRVMDLFDRITAKKRKSSRASAIVDRCNENFGCQLEDLEILWLNIKRAYNICEDQDLPMGDGLDEENRSMTWAGKTYSRIPKRAIKVLWLLLRRYTKKDSGTLVELWEIGEIASVTGGMKSQVFKTDDGIHPVVEIIDSPYKGYYRLKRPDEITD